MNLKLLTYCFLVLIFFACAEEKIKKQDYNSLFNQEMKSISFNEVDIYPSFETCKTSEEALATKNCFVKTIHLHLKPFFENNTSAGDHLNLSLQIDKKGILQVVDIQPKNEESIQLKENLNLYLQAELPTIYPAQKQGIPVTCTLILPITFNDSLE